MMKNLDRRQSRGRRQQIFAEVGGHRLRVIVVDHALEQGVANTVNDATDDLAFHYHLIDQPSTVAHDDIPQDAHRAGLSVDFDLDAMAGVAVCEAGGKKVRGLLETRLDIPGE